MKTKIGMSYTVSVGGGRTGWSRPAPARDTTQTAETLARIQALVAAGELDRASAQADTAITDGFEHPLLLNLSAWRLEQNGKYPEAEARLRRALVLAPEDISTLHALGLCLAHQDRPLEALPLFDQVVARHPGFAPGHANRGAILEMLGQVMEAEASYRRALELQPDQLAALLGMAKLAVRRGRSEEAQALAEAVLAREPNLPEATTTLAEAELAQKQASPAAERLQALLTDSRVTPPQRARALSVLGDALDRLDRPSEAFAAYAEGNAIQHDLNQARFGQGGDLLDYARALRAWAQAAPETPTHADRPRESQASEHVFLLGFPRSGTTLLEQVLASHPAVVALEERETLVDGALQFLNSERSGLDALARAEPAMLAQLRTAYWARVSDEGVDVAGKVFLDKHPLNTLKLPLIARLFPQAKILFAVRDPRDVVLSCFRRRFAINSAMFNFLTLEGAADFYVETVEAGLALEPRLGLAWRQVRHETLVEGFDAEVADICAFLNLEWDEAMRGFASRAKQSATPSAAQVAQGLNASGVGQWRRYTSELDIIADRLHPLVRRLGYAPD